MPGVPRTPASEPSATSAHHHHLGRPDDIYMSSETFWLESSSHSCLPRPQFTPYAVDTQWLFMSGFKVFSDAEKAAAPQLHPTLVAALQLFLLGLVLGWVLVLQQRWYVCVEVVHPRTASQAVVQKSATGAVQWFPNQEMMSHIIFFPAGLDNALTRPHHDTSTFCLNQSLYNLINQGHILNKPPHRHLGHLARQLHPTSRSRLPQICGGLLSA